MDDGSFPCGVLKHPFDKMLVTNAIKNVFNTGAVNWHNLFVMKMTSCITRPIPFIKIQRVGLLFPSPPKIVTNRGVDGKGSIVCTVVLP